jgi:hypothetical protein
MGQCQGTYYGAGSPFTPARIHTAMQPVAANVIPEQQCDPPVSMNISPIRQPRPRHDVNVGGMDPVSSNRDVTLQVVVAIALPSQHSVDRQTPAFGYAHDQRGHDESDRVDYTLGLYRCAW